MGGLLDWDKLRIFYVVVEVGLFMYVVESLYLL